MPPQDERQDSVFNMALAYLKRIDKLLTLCQHAAFRGDMQSWAAHLRGIYREASIRLNAEEVKDIDGDSSIKIDLVTLLDSNIEKREANFRNVNFLMNSQLLKNKNRRTIMFLLDALEIKLREVMQKRNMLLPSKQDPTKAVLNM